MESFESKRAAVKSSEELNSNKVQLGFFKYFWMASGLAPGGSESIPKFLRNLEVLKSFTENDLRIFSGFLHQRTFEDGELIFKQGQIGIGFYFILSGNVELWINSTSDEISSKETNQADSSNKKALVLTLEKGDYFGELALLQSTSFRSATAVAQGPTKLLGIFKPDLEELIDIYPLVGAKLLQSIANILANRLQAMTEEYKSLKSKLIHTNAIELEGSNSQGVKT